MSYHTLCKGCGEECDCGEEFTEDCAGCSICWEQHDELCPGCILCDAPDDDHGLL